MKPQAASPRDPPSRAAADRGEPLQPAPQGEPTVARAELPAERAPAHAWSPGDAAPRPTHIGAPLGRILGSFRFAWAGLLAIVRTQPNSWVHLGAALIAIGLAILLRLPPEQLAILALAIGLVLATEAVNTAVEALGDAVSPAYHPLVKRAKDAAAAAVLLAALTAVAVGLALFGPPLWSAVSAR